MQRKEHKLLTDNDLAGLPVALPEWTRVCEFLECWYEFSSFRLAM